MTNEERARAIRRTWGLNIALAASASKSDLREACDGLEAAILAALNAATAELEEERGRLRGVLYPEALEDIARVVSPHFLHAGEALRSLAEVQRSALAKKEPSNG